VKVLVANRGEIAVRVIRAAREIGWLAVAVHPADDAESLHVRKADEAVELPGSGTAAYLDAAAIVEAARSASCDAVHPGYGFLSESAELARRCAAAGIAFVGPSPAVLDLFGDKAGARSFAVSCGVPVLPGTSGETSVDEVAAFATEHGAVMVKAVAGGGGRGMREVRDPEQVAQAYREASQEAARAFGRAEVYVEKLVVAPRHIEIQVVGDGESVVTVGERDCSIQRRHQKLVEVAPSPWLDDDTRARITASALVLAKRAGYAGLGTFEFLVSGGEHWFMEANPRLQVEHTVTEETSGVDLVVTQLRIADGSSLTELGLDSSPELSGVAIQARVNAESLSCDGTPIASAGTLRQFDMPSGPGVRVDTYGYRGYRTSPRYDSLLAKVITHAATFEQAVARMVEALEDAVVDGVDTNLDLLHGIIGDAAFTQDPWDTGFLPRHLPRLLEHRRPSVLTAAVAEEVPEAGEDIPADAIAIRAASAGVVVECRVGTGDEIAAGARVFAVEAMKMEAAVLAPESMRIARRLVEVGDLVRPGTPLAFGYAAEHVGTPIGPEADADADWSADVAEIGRRTAAAALMGGPEKLARQRKTGRLNARERIARLADPDTFSEIGALSGFATYDGDGPAEFTPANFVAGTACLDGRRVLLGVDDFTLRGGSGDAAIHEKQIFAERYARQMRMPVIRLLDGASGGGSVKMAMSAGYTYIPVNPGWDAVVENLSLVPVVAAGVGPTVGLGAARLVMSHLAILVEGIGQMFTAGPPVVQEATGERLTKEQLGGAEIHRGTGSVERIVGSEDEAFDVIRRFLGYLPGNVFELPPVIGNEDPADRRDEALLGLVPRSTRVGYPVAPLLGAVFDEGSVFRYAEYGGGTVTALARLDGHPVGVIASDVARGITMTREGALAVTRLADLCSTFHLPIVSLTDQGGMAIGREAEGAATIRHGARAISAIYQATVPQAEVVVRRVYGVGGAGVVNRHAASRNWVWPSGDWGSLPARGGIEAAFRAQLAAAEEPAAELERLTQVLARTASPFRTAEHFGVQDLIDPRETRPLLCEWVRDAYRILPEQLGRPAFGTRP